MKKRLIGVFTGNRAEYGLQLPILKAIKKNPKLDYRLFVSGAHLDKNFGRTLEEIKNDGFQIHKEIKIKMDADNLVSNVKAIGSGILSIGKALNDEKLDLMVVYADRFEGLAAVVASTQMNIPTAHIEGGDLTEGGALDDSVRHAMTKLSHLHFTTNEQASNRILAMGEEDWRVHTIGFPAIDLISENNFASPNEIENNYNIKQNDKVIIFTQHSVTTEFEKAKEQIIPSLNAMKMLANEGFKIFITYPNNDAGGKSIINEILILKKESIKNIFIKKSLGRYYFHGFLALARNENYKIVCVGNSSSGIKETPAFGCPTVNIGSRQLGRLRGSNVLDTNYDQEEIYKCIKNCVYDNKIFNRCKNTTNPYFLGGAGEKFAKIISEIDLSEKIFTKKMMLRGEIQNGWFR